MCRVIKSGELYLESATFVKDGSVINIRWTDDVKRAKRCPSIFSERDLNIIKRSAKREMEFHSIPVTRQL